MPKPMRMPSIAIAGNSATCVSTPPTICVVTGVADQPTAADAMSSTSSTVVRLMTPRTVIPPRHSDTGPSVIGSVPAAFGGAQVVPPGLGGFGAAQPALASAIAFSLRTGLGMGTVLQSACSPLVANLIVILSPPPLVLHDSTAYSSLQPIGGHTPSVCAMPHVLTAI